MPTHVINSSIFDNDAKRLQRKYPSVADEIDTLTSQLEHDLHPGVRLRRVGSHVYKVRLPNRSARRGKSGGFRVIYRERDGALVLLLLIYSKSERADIPDDVIRRVIAEFET